MQELSVRIERIRQEVTAFRTLDSEGITGVLRRQINDQNIPSFDRTAEPAYPEAAVQIALRQLELIRERGVDPGMNHMYWGIPATPFEAFPNREIRQQETAIGQREYRAVEPALFRFVSSHMALFLPLLLIAGVGRGLAGVPDTDSLRFMTTAPVLRRDIFWAKLSVQMVTVLGVLGLALLLPRLLPVTALVRSDADYPVPVYEITAETQPFAQEPEALLLPASDLPQARRGKRG